jgi:hypothetical protein
MFRCSTRFALSLGFALLAVVAGSPVLRAQTATTNQSQNVHYTLHYPVVDQPYTNQCNGEAVNMNGEEVYDYRFWQDSDGDSTFFEIKSNLTLTGVGSVSGAKYVATDSQLYLTRTHDIASNFTTSEKIKMIAQGPTPDMLLTQRTHVVVDKRGNILVDKVGAPVVKCKDGGTGPKH